MQLSCCCENGNVGRNPPLQPSQLHCKTIQQRGYSSLWVNINELIYSKHDDTICDLFYYPLYVLTARESAAVCALFLKLDKKIHICWLLVSNWSSQPEPYQILPRKRPLTFTHTTQILPLRAHLIPLFPLLIPVKSCHYRERPSSHLSIPISAHPSLSMGPLIRHNFPPLPHHSPSLSPVPLFSRWPKIYDNKMPDAADSEGWPRGDPRFPHQPLSHFSPASTDSSHTRQQPLAAYERISHHILSEPRHHHHHPNSSHPGPFLNTHTHTHTLAKRDWLDMICGKTKEKQKQQRRESEGEWVCVDEGI